MSTSFDKLDEVRRAFEHWRATRDRQGKIPGYLWEQVKPLLNDYPLTRITSALGVNNTQIRENVVQEDSVQFVEVTSQQSSSIRQYNQSQSSTCAIELHRPCGSVLKISELPVSMVSKLIPEFIG